MQLNTILNTDMFSVGSCGFVSVFYVNDVSLLLWPLKFSVFSRT